MSDILMNAALGSVAVGFSLFLLYAAKVPSETASLGSMGKIPPVSSSKQDYSYRLDSLPGGDFAPLRHGNTRFYLSGPEHGRKIVLIHGIGTTAIAFKHLSNLLVQKGFRVLLYDFYGRGYSDSPGIRNTESLFVDQLSDLLDYLNWKSCDILGWSMGGAVAVSFTAAFPHRVDRLILLAPAGLLDPRELPFVAKLVKMPVLGELIMHSLGPFVMQRELTRLNRHSPEYFASNPHVQYLPQLLKDHLRYHPGFLRSYHSSLKYFPLQGLDERYAQVGKLFQGQVDFVWGSADLIVPFKLSSKATQLLPKSRLHVLEGLGHDIVVADVDSLLRHLQI